MPAATPPPNRILIIRPSALGDVCRSVPVLAGLRAAYPTAQIDWLVQDTFADAIAAHPALSGVVRFDRRRYGRWTSPAAMAALARWLRALGRTGYDLVLDCQGLLRSAIFTQATGAPRRLGHADARELAWAAYSERVPHRVASVHTVDRMLELAAAAGAAPVKDMRLYAPDPPPPSTAPGLVGDLDPRLSTGPVVVIAPTSRWLGKRWPAGRFAALARAILAPDATRDASVIALVGSASERDQCGSLLELAETESRVVDLVGRTSVAALMRLIRRSALVVANDSAAVHIAVGFDRPLVALHGPTDVARVGPYGRESDVITHARAEECLDHKDEARGVELMSRIGVDEVVAAALARLNRR